MKTLIHTTLALSIFAGSLSATSNPVAAQSMRVEPVEANETYRANGNEPFWGLTIQGDTISFEHAGVIELTGTYADPVRNAGTTVYIGRIEERSGDMTENFPTGLPLIVLVADQPCSDSMAGTPYPNTVGVVAANDYYTGCGGNPRDILAGEPWAITHLMETPFSGDPAITMAFDTEGGVSGSSGCNRYSASYEMGEGLSFGPIRSTRRACPGAIGENEQRIFTAMRSVISIDHEQNGDLVLYSEHGPVLRLSR